MDSNRASQRGFPWLQSQWIPHHKLLLWVVTLQFFFISAISTPVLHLLQHSFYYSQLIHGSSNSHPKPHPKCPLHHWLFGSFPPFDLFSLDWWFWHGRATVPPRWELAFQISPACFHSDRSQTCQRPWRNAAFPNKNWDLCLPTGSKLWSIPSILINIMRLIDNREVKEISWCVTTWASKKKMSVLKFPQLTVVGTLLLGDGRKKRVMKIKKNV